MQLRQPGVLQQPPGPGDLSGPDQGDDTSYAGEEHHGQVHRIHLGCSFGDLLDYPDAEWVVLDGEQDIMGNPWIGFNEVITKCWREGKGKDAVTVCEDYLSKIDTLWNGGDWNGTSWSGTSWSGTSWSGLSWSGTSWSGTSWSGLSWSNTTWSNMAWNGTSWSGTSWSGTSWSGTSWSGLSWSSSGTAAASQGLRWD